MTGAKYRVLLAAALSVALAACGTEFKETPAPTPVTITEPPFTGTLTPNGAVPFAFLAGVGSVTVVVNSLTPSTDATRIGVAIGSWNGTGCQLLIANDNAFVSTVVVGTATATAALCVRVSDARGTLTEPVNFELTITHF
jgi:hypothetical protein